VPPRNLYFLQDDGSEIAAPFIPAETEVYEPGFDPANVYAPTIAAATSVFAPTIMAASTTPARLSQEAVEALVSPNPHGRVSQVAVEALVSPIAFGRLTQLPVEVLIFVADPQARLSQIPVEILQRKLYETIEVLIID
jgi:hypothetical protein